MTDKLINFCQRLAIYGLIMIIGIPLSLLFVGSASAKGSQTVNKKTAVETKIPTEKTTSITKTIAFLGAPTGLAKGSTYVVGQPVSFKVKISGDPKKVWTNLGEIDPELSWNIYLQNFGDGIWYLKTPKLSTSLILGSHILKIYAQGDNGEIVNTQVKMTFVQLEKVSIVSYKVTGENNAVIDWNPIKWADLYEVNWQIVGGENIVTKSIITKEHSVMLSELLPGTSYVVTIQGLRGDVQGPSQKVTFKTFGEAPIKEIMGTTDQSSRASSITPQIAQGVSTSNKQVAQSAPKLNEQIKPETTASPSPSPSPKDDGKTGNWNKLLVAISILIIAAGAAIGGYYGYEWLVMRSKDEEPPKPKSNSRW